MTTQIQRYLSIWWLRILIFVLFSSLLLVSFEQLLSLYGLDDIIFDSYLTQEFIFFFVLVLMSVIIEEFRVNSKWYAFGITFDIQTLKYIILIFFIIFISFSLILLLSFTWNYNIKLSDFTFAAFIYLLILVFLTSSTEELLFRGIFFQAIQQRFGDSLAVFSTSLVFGVLHLFNPNFSFISLLNTIFAGALLGFLYLKTKSLIIPIMFHFFWNFGQSFMLNSNVSGYNMYLKLFDINLTKMPQYIFGGNYGIEGGLITTFLLIIYFPIFNKFLKPSPFINSILLLREIEESKFSFK